MKVSVAMCTYNGSRFVREQLRSIAAQSRLPDELVVCDDRSTDATVEILEEFAVKVPFPVRIIVNSENMGSTRNFEKAISICRGDVIVLTDQDDSWCVNRLQVTEIVLKQRPDVGAVFADAYIVDKDLKPLGYNLWKAVQFNRRLKCQVEEGNAFEALLAHNFVTGATMAFRAEFRALIIPIPALWVHDGWIAIIISAFANVACIDQPLIQYRQHSCQQLGARRQSMVARIASTQALDNRVNYRQMPEQFRCVFERLKETAGYEVPQRLKDLLQEKIRHMSQRAILPKSHLRRLSPIAGELVSNRYRRFGYGWKGVLRDLLVNLDG